MALRRAALAAVTAIVIAGCAGLGDQDAADELADFSTTTSEGAGTPYEVYLRIAEENGADLLDAAEVEQRATLLCADDGIIEDPSVRDEWSLTERAIVRSYCPYREVGP